MFETVEKKTTRYWATRKVKEQREAKELTMEAMASALGVSRGYYCRIENGNISINEETYYKIAEMLN